MGVGVSDEDDEEDEEDEEDDEEDNEVGDEDARGLELEPSNPLWDLSVGKKEKMLWK